MGMIGDFIRIYGCILGAILVTGGLSAIWIGALLLLTLNILGIFLVVAGLAVTPLGAGIIWLILRRKEPDIYAPPPGWAPYPGAPAVTVRDRLNLPPLTVLFAIFIGAVMMGALALMSGNIIMFLIPFIVASTFPPIMWISYVYGQDRLEPEPPRLVLIALTGGMLSIVPALLVNTLAGVAAVLIALYRGLDPVLMYLLVPVIVAPLIEELVKPAVLTSLKKEMTTDLDGVLYGVTAGMGFALLENMSYLLFGFTAFGGFSDAGAFSMSLVWLLTALSRGLGSIMVHAAGPGLIGLAYVRYLRGGAGTGALFRAYGTAVLIHAGWNGISMLTTLEPIGGGLDLPVFIAAIIIFAVGIFMLMRSMISGAAKSDMMEGRQGIKTRRRDREDHYRWMLRLEKEWARYYMSLGGWPPGHGHSPSPGGYPPPAYGHDARGPRRFREGHEYGPGAGPPHIHPGPYPGRYGPARDPYERGGPHYGSATGDGRYGRAGGWGGQVGRADHRGGYSNDDTDRGERGPRG